MKTELFILVSLPVLLTVWAERDLPPGVDQRMYCEACLATVKELKKIPKEESGELSRAKIKAGMRNVCATFSTEENMSGAGEVSNACSHLLETYEDTLVDILLLEKANAAETNLCYIHIPACTGLKKKQFQADNHLFSDGVEEFLQKHAERVRRVRPTATASHQASHNRKEEL